MTTPWDRITDDVYKAWLLEAMTVEEYNNEPPLNRRTLRTQFQQQQQQQQKPPVFLVSAVIRGALRSQGARGNVYKALEKHHGLFSKSAGKQVAYNGDDLVVKAYFESKGEAMDFQSALNEWELHKALLLLDGVEIDPPDPLSVHQPQDLSRFYLQHCQPNESESPCQTLNQLESYRLSIPITEGVEPSDPVAIYQSLDVLEETNHTNVT